VLHGSHPLLFVVPSGVRQRRFELDASTPSSESEWTAATMGLAAWKVPLARNLMADLSST